MSIDELDDALYKGIKRGDLVLFWSSEYSKWGSGYVPAIIKDAHDSKTVTLIVAPRLRLDSTPHDRLEVLEHHKATWIHERVPRFKSGGDRHNTWCGIH